MPPSFRPVVAVAHRLGRSNLLALILSVVVHGTMFMSFYHAVYRESAQAKPVIPEARLAPPAGPSDQQESIPPLRLSQRESPLPANAPKPRLDDIPMIAVAESAVDMESRMPALLPPRNTAVSTGSGSLVQFAGVPGASAGPTCSFFGASGNAYRVVFVVDISVSVSFYLRDIRQEMSDSIRHLTPAQQFNIITSISNQGDLIVNQLSPDRLLYANEENKRAAAQFIGAFRSNPGAFDPIRTLKIAYELKPDLIYLLSDGAYDNLTDELVAALREFRERHPARITVISFDPSPRHVQLLQTIARETGGNFRLVEESRLRD